MRTPNASFDKFSPTKIDILAICEKIGVGNLRAEMKDFFSELKRRNVYKVAVAYIVAGWALSQGIAQVFPVFDVPNWIIRLIVLLIILGLPIALVLAWMFEITPQGIKRADDVVLEQPRPSGHAWIYIAAIAGALSLGLFLLGRYTVRTSEAPSDLPAKSIAVLPFENLSEEKSNAYFATGIQDEILTRLAKIGTLKVISRVSTQQYAARPGNLTEIAHQLGVANVLEGSVQKAADQVHVNVQLIRALTNEHIWAESYDCKLSEGIFAVEGEVAQKVAEALNAELTGPQQQALERKPTNNPEAYQAYLRGIALYGETNYADEVKAMQSFEEAVALDPNFALAWAMLSRTNSDSYFTGATSSGRAAAEKALGNAMRLQPHLPEVQLAQATYQVLVLRDYEHAGPIFERLLTELPNDADVPSFLVFVSLAEGKWPESRAYVDRAIALNPLDRTLRHQAAYVRRTTRDFSSALKCYDQALTIWPEDSRFIAGKAVIYQLLGDLDGADALLKSVHPTAKNDFAGLEVICDQAKLRRSYSDIIGFLRSFLNQAGSLPASASDYYLEYVADLERLSGDVVTAKANYTQRRDTLQQKLREEPDHADSISEELSKAYAGLGDSQLAMTYIERAISLMPASKDAWFGPQYEETRSRIAARFGMTEIAIPALEHLLRTSYVRPLTPALLRLDPDFDSLRGDPRFEKLAHSDGK